MKYLLRSWVHRLFSARSARTIRRSPALQVEALEDRTTPSFVGVKMIEIAPGSAASNPAYFTEVNGIVYFAATDSSGDRELWRTDGTASGTYRLRDINPGSSSSNPRDLISLNGELYFSAFRSDIGRELWRYNPATDTLTFSDIFQGSFASRPFSSSPSSFAILNGYLYFNAENGTFAGRELFRYDPSTESVSLVANIKDDGYSTDASSNPTDLVALDGYLYFCARHSAYGRELFRYDPSISNPNSSYNLVKDINPGYNFSDPQFVRDLGDILYFSADDGSTGRELWRSDGTSSGTYPVADLNSSGNSNPRFMTPLNGELYFSATDSNGDTEFYRYDPASNNDPQKIDINSSGSSDPRFLTAWNNKVYFTADGGDGAGRELWSYDPATNQSVRVFDINPGSGSSDPQFLRVANGQLFFSADDGSGVGRELWRTGTATTLNIIGGHHQNTLVTQPFTNPLQVMVLDHLGETLLAVPVTFTAPTSGASAKFGGNSTTTVTTTDANGQTQVNATANKKAGTYTVTASVGNVTTGFTLKNDPDDPAALQIVSGNNQNVTVGMNFGDLVVQLVDQYGNAVSQSGVDVTFAAPGSGASLSPVSSTVTTDANGQATLINPQANTIAGSYYVQVTSGFLISTQFQLTNTPGAAAQFVVLGGGGQSTQVGTAFSNSLVIQVLDAFGNPVPGATVSFTATSSTTGASATLSSSTVTTNSSGQAAVNATANTIAGSYTVTASVGSLTTSFTLTNTPGALSQLAFNVQPPTAVSVGQRFRVQVQLRDQYGNAVRLPNVAIRLSLRVGSGLSGTLVKRTSANGLATFGDLVLSAPGRYRLVARLGNGLQVISRAIVVS